MQLIKFTPKPKEEEEDLAPDEILEYTIDADLDQLLCVGWTKDDHLFYDSNMKKQEVLYMLEKFKMYILADDE